MVTDTDEHGLARIAMVRPWPRKFMRCLGALLTVAFGLFVPQVCAAGGIPWIADYDVGIEKAGAEHRAVLIDFTAEWCGWCKRLDEEVYADAATVNALKDFVCLKINVDKQPNVALAYNVQSMPRTIAINAHGEIVGDLIGYQPLGPFLEFLRGLKEDLARKTGGMSKPDIRDNAKTEAPGKPAITPKTPSGELIALIGDPDPAVRLEAIRIVNAKEDKFQILVTALASTFLGSRITALETLKKAGAPEIAFDPWGTRVDRELALPKWKRWAEQQQPPTLSEASP